MIYPWIKRVMELHASLRRHSYCGLDARAEPILLFSKPCGRRSRDVIHDTGENPCSRLYMEMLEGFLLGRQQLKFRQHDTLKLWFSKRGEGEELKVHTNGRATRRQYYHT
jgi:hypothetical protein